MKLVCAERGPLAVVINDRLRKFKPGDTFEVDAEQGKKLLGITPAVVVEHGVVEQVKEAVTGKKGKKKAAEE